MKGFPCLVSVIIPTLNAARLLPYQLAALAQQSYPDPWELIIADNGSQDGTIGLGESWASRLPHLRVIHATGRKGVNHARNVGAGGARGDLLVFCDADDVASPGWLEAMAYAARNADLVGGFTDQVTLNNPSIRSWRLPKPRYHLPVKMGFLPYAPGASLGIRSSVFQILGGFNEDYVGGGDDVEFCWRAQLLGYTLAFASDAVMFYRYRDTLRSLAKQAYGIGRSDAKLLHDFSDCGIPTQSVRLALRDWVRLALRFTDLSSPLRAGAWVNAVTRRSGRFVGSVRYRVRCF